MSRLPGPRLWQQGLLGLRMRRDLLGEIVKLHERYGPVFATGAGPVKFVWLIGPDAHRELFVDVDRFSWREVTKPIMVVDGETAVVLSDWAPALEAPAGAERLTLRVKPADMLEPMLAVILAPVWFVVTAHVAAAVALVGLLPAVAVLITSEGLPENAT